ncbi:MAG: hypothetical protein CSA31_02850 [Desulfobulbus propionicus]|nr:MAG: hypothetical protein CSA31_02850 [Desulfobulbus propionicus]
MLILSPSKGQDFETRQPLKVHTEPLFLDKSMELIKLLRGYSVDELRELMQISEKIARLNVDRYQAFTLPFSMDNAKSAFFAFTGDVYQGIQAADYNDDDVAFAQKNVRILSGLYGCLKPFDLIQPYRLEMKTKLTNQKGDTLYKFWGTQVAEAINEAALQSEAPYLFNLASNEYSKVIPKKSITVPFIDIVFQEEKEGKLPEDIKAFDKNGYQYSAELSTDKRFVFTRPQP